MRISYAVVILSCLLHCCLHHYAYAICFLLKSCTHFSIYMYTEPAKKKEKKSNTDSCSIMESEKIMYANDCCSMVDVFSREGKKN